MKTYNVTLNGSSIFSGTLEACLKHLVEMHGESTVSEVYNAGYRIE